MRYLLPEVVDLAKKKLGYPGGFIAKMPYDVSVRISYQYLDETLTREIWCGNSELLKTSNDIQDLSNDIDLEIRVYDFDDELVGVFSPVRKS